MSQPGVGHLRQKRGQAMDSDEVIGAVLLAVVLAMLFWLHQAGHIGSVLTWK